MARVKGKAQVNTFDKGLVTDAHVMNTVPGTTIEEDNCELDRRGFRRRRLGLTYEDGYVFSSSPASVTDADTFYIKTYKWKDINNTPNLHFLVVQFGNTLYFYDTAYDPLSTGQKTFTVDLDDFAAPGVTSTATQGIAVTSGKGRLFVVGALIEPFYITYSEATDDITTTELTLKIRDTKLQDTTTAFDARPTTLTDALKYDLYNQGWGYDLVNCNDSIRYGSVVLTGQIAIEYYFFATDHYPPRTKPWWVGKRTGVDPGEAGFEIFDPNGVYDQVYAGTTVGALGHYILNYFAKDRTTASGIAGFSIDTITTRPTSVAFMAGRVFYGHENNILFSQLITDDLSAAERCYQEADPTGEDINELIATDGGILTIPQSGTVLKFEVLENSLMAFYNNGIWAIGGTTPGDGFSALGYSVNKVSGEGALSSRTIFSFEGTVTWWSDHGIFVMARGGSSSGFYETKILTNEKIQVLYDTISPVSKEFATGAYDKIRKRVIWLYRSATDQDSAQDRFYYDRVLNYDTTKEAFFPFSISSLGVSQPSYLCDVFNKSNSVITSDTETVVDSSGVVVTAADASSVVVTRYTYGTPSLVTDVKYLVTGPTIVQAPLDTGVLCPNQAANNVPVTTGNSGEVTSYAGNLNGEWTSPEFLVCGNPFVATAGCSISEANGLIRLTEEDYHFYMPYLRVYDFEANIPSGATITGVEARIEFGAYDAFTNLTVDDWRLAWGASAATLSTNSLDDEAPLMNVAQGDGATFVVGGNGEMWGMTSATLTPAIVNTSDFGFVFKFARADIDPASFPNFRDTVNMGFIPVSVGIKIFYSV